MAWKITAAAFRRRNSRGPLFPGQGGQKENGQAAESKTGGAQRGPERSTDGEGGEEKRRKPGGGDFCSVVPGGAKGSEGGDGAPMASPAERR